MGKLALTHRGRSKVLPSVGLLDPFIERTENHWYWLAEFFDDGLDRSAEFVWAPPAEKTTQYMVPRLLWQLTHPDVDMHRTMLENTCGLFTCINPAHWQKRRGGPKIPARIVLPDSVEAMPVLYPSALLTVHIRRHDSINTVCGHGPRHRGLAKATVITCDDCIATWIRLDQPYKETT